MQYYRLKKNVTPAMLEAIGIFGKFGRKLRRARFEISGQRVAEFGGALGRCPAADLKWEVAYGVPMQYIEKVPARKKVAKSKSRKLVLPSLAAFQKLPLAKRTALFVRWVGTQRGPYKYQLPRKCPLGQFGRAIARPDPEKHYSSGICTTFHIRDVATFAVVVPEIRVIDWQHEDALIHSGTYGELFKALSALLPKKKSKK